MLDGSTGTDWGVCSWPWQLFALGKADIPLCVNSNRCIPVKNTMGRRAVVFWACDIILSAVFHVIIAMYKFHLGFLWTKNQRNVDQWTERHAVRDSHVFDTICMICFLQTAVASVKKFYPGCAGQLFCRIRDSKRSASLAGWFTSGKEPGTDWIGGFVGPSVDLVFSENRKASCSSRHSNPGASTHRFIFILTTRSHLTRSCLYPIHSSNNNCNYFMKQNTS